jgi:hypothetical protein
MVLYLLNISLQCLAPLWKISGDLWLPVDPSPPKLFNGVILGVAAGPFIPGIAMLDADLWPRGGGPRPEPVVRTKEDTDIPMKVSKQFYSVDHKFALLDNSDISIGTFCRRRRVD